MKYLSVCSGIEAATVAWHPLGWNPVAFSEIEKFPSMVLAHHYPNVQNLGDMTNFKEWNIGTIDILVGGTPCQSFSIAGLRKGLEDPRGNLMLTFLGIAQRFGPQWIIWENVPGVLSSNGGRDFGTFLSALGRLGYGFAYRVLDAQWFGVAQRRRRVFVVGCLGDWRRAAAVLFERDSLSGNPAPSREKKKETTCFTPSSIGGYSEGIGTLRANGGDIGGGSETLVAATVAFTARDYGNDATTELAPTMRSLTRGADGHQSGSAGLAVLQDMKVRRLTPMECERLQGFPDNYTNIPNAADGPRYKALGNSMAVPVMTWLGKRIQMMGNMT